MVKSLADTNQAQVFLVGAGPGDPELLTLKALRVMQGADVVVYDRLVSPEVLDLLPPGAARIDVGKQPGLHPVPQDEINRLLARLAVPGRTVVRLKGGDPNLFGRGGEEALFLASHGIPFETVAGFTAASAAASAIGVPLTHRGVANGVRFMAGRGCEESALDVDWASLADPNTTLVVYMGLANFPQTAVRLMAHGLDPATPVAAICNATRADQRHLISTLGEVAGPIADATFDGPVLFVIGRVVDLAACAGETAEPLAPMVMGARRA